MECFTRAVKVSKYHMRRMRKTARIPFLFLIAMLYVMGSLSPVLTFSCDVRIDVTPFAFVFVTNHYKTQFMIAACAVILFCNAPFEDSSYLYIVSRAGKRSWGLGMLLYILKLSTLYLCALIAATALPFIGHIKWSNEWGKIWGTLGKTDAGASYQADLSVSENIMREYEPLQALIISILLEFGCIAVIGMIVYLGNKVTGKAVGTMLGAFLTVLDICVSNDWASWAYGFSPVSLAQLDLFYGYASKWGIDLSFAAKFFLIAIAGLGSLCVAVNDRLLIKLMQK